MLDTPLGFDEIEAAIKDIGYDNEINQLHLLRNFYFMGMPELSSLAKSCLTKVKAPRRWAVVLGILLTSAWYVLNPSGTAFILVAESELRLELPEFQRLEIEFGKPTNVKTCIVGQPESYTGVTPASSSTGHDKTIDEVLTTLKLENYYTNRSSQSGLLVQSVSIKFASADHVEIVKASIDEKSIDLEKFLSVHIRTPASITKNRYFRFDFARTIAPLNDFVSNWVLTIMFFATAWIFAVVIGLELSTYVFPRSMFCEHLKKASGETDLSSSAGRKRASEQCADMWSRRDSGYKYLQAIGPAAGFIMTVASLIYSLSTAKVDVQLLLGGMHIAMVSTFLGLLLRIIALEGERVSLQLLAREMSEIDALSESGQ